MSLHAASKLATNLTMAARVAAAIRQTAPLKAGAEGPPRSLAHRVMAAPDAADGVAAHFLVRLAMNGDAAAASCPDCGYSTVADSDVLWIVDHEWDAVAAIVTPS